MSSDRGPAATVWGRRIAALLVAAAGGMPGIAARAGIAGAPATAATPAATTAAANSAPASAAPASADSEFVQTVRGVIESARHPLLKWCDFPYYQDEMQGLYAPLADGPVWLASGQPRPQVDDVLDVLRDAGNRGLDPTDYDVDLLASRLAALRAGNPLEPHELALFDTALSLAYLRCISDLHIGRITPRRVNMGFDVESKKYDLPDLVRRALAENRIRQTADAAEPQLAVYRRLKAVLQTYRQLAQDGAWPPLRIDATVRPGDAFPDLAALAQRLATLGDLDAAAAAAAQPGSPYTGEIVAAVQRFQGRHGLGADGVLGAKTAAALDVPPARRLRQIEFALERLRWLPDLSGGKFLAVNIPAFLVWGFDSLNAAGRPALSMRVVVGKALDTRTPVFVAEMEYVVFRPYWNVPYSIVRGELLPALRRDPGALAARDMEIVRGFDDATALPATPENIGQLAAGALKVRQRPGPRNALGAVKFIFPNRENVYMHDTPSTALFARTRRDFSHGCIRLEDPVAMAQFVIADQLEWTRERILVAMRGNRPERVDLRRPIAVILFYTTALVDLEGKVHFYDDIYGHDARIEKELESGYPFQP